MHPCEVHARLVWYGVVLHRVRWGVRGVAGLVGGVGYGVLLDWEELRDNLGATQ